MTRVLLLVHRYLGIAICLLLAAWCVSGAIMLYVPYPGLDEGARVRALPQLRWQGCCAHAAARAELGSAAISHFRVEMQAGSPMLLAFAEFGAPQVIDLGSGRRRDTVDARQALAIAGDYAGGAAPAAAARLIEYDQWTVSGEFAAVRPLYHVALGDRAGTELYVSSVTGDVVQRTTRWQRAWNYPGAVTHWLYATTLRANGALWSRLVIWSALAGAFLTLVGLYVGVAQWWRARTGLSPYRGVYWWHHVSGLVFGVLALTWAGSGLLSMNPWGLLERGGSAEERAVLRGRHLDGDEVIAALQQWTERQSGAPLTSLSGAAFNGALQLLAHDGTRPVRHSALAQAEPIGPDDLHQAALAVAGAARLSSYGLLHAGDAYFYADAGAAAMPSPVYAFIVDDGEQTRYYLDPRDGSLLRKVDAAGRAYRWWFSALHRWDFAPALRRSPWRDALVLSLLGGVTALCLTGAWLGCRRVARSLA